MVVLVPSHSCGDLIFGGVKATPCTAKKPPSGGSSLGAPCRTRGDDDARTEGSRNAYRWWRLASHREVRHSAPLAPNQSARRPVHQRFTDLRDVVVLLLLLPIVVTLP